MDSKQALLDKWDYIVKEYSIPSVASAAIPVSYVPAAIVGVPAVCAKKASIVGSVLGGVVGGVVEAVTGNGAAAAATATPVDSSVAAGSIHRKGKIDKDKIPDDLFKNECALFYKQICHYCDERNITESQLYNLAKVSRAVYSNIRSMAQKAYIPSKNTIIQLCIALHLELAKAQELLGILGYHLSNSLIVDKVVSWCLERTEYEYDVDSINDIIYEKTNGQYCLLKA